MTLIQGVIALNDVTVGCKVQCERSRPLIHVAGNSVMDLLLWHAPLNAGRPEDGWSSGNVHFLGQPVDAPDADASQPWRAMITTKGD